MSVSQGYWRRRYVLMRAGLSGREVLAVLVAFSVFYAAVGLIGARDKLPGLGATHSLMRRSRPLGARQRNGQGHPVGAVRGFRSRRPNVRL